MKPPDIVYIYWCTLCRQPLCTSSSPYEHGMHCRCDNSGKSVTVDIYAPKNVGSAQNTAGGGPKVMPEIAELFGTRGRSHCGPVRNCPTCIKYFKPRWDCSDCGGTGVKR